MGTTQRVIRLAWPVLVAQLATIGMMAIDTIVVGRAGTDELAALAVGASIYVSVALALSGVVQSLLPGVAHCLGKQDRDAAAHLIRQAFWLVLMLAVVGDLILWLPGWIIAYAQLSDPVAAMTTDYLRVLAFSLPASLGYRAFHAIAGGVGRTRPLMWMSLAQTSCHALLAPLLADSISIGGITLGLGLGAVGAAASQALLAWLVCLTGLLVLWRSANYRTLMGSLGLWPGSPDWATQSHLLRVGVPMGLSYFVEISAFTLMAIFIARLGPEMLAGHRIVANISAMVYMFPLAVGTATAALVGQADGAADVRGAEALARSAFRLAGVGALLLGLLLWVLREPLAALGSPDPAVQSVAVGLIAYVAAYQLSDALQTIAGFALRGYHVTLVPLGVHLASFWLFGLGGGYWLAFDGLAVMGVLPMGAAGFWCAALVATLVATLGLGGLLFWVQSIRRRDCPAT
jgi:MATE family multidrug resistance protein